METVLKAISDWIKSLLTAAIMSNLSGLFDDVNTQVGSIAQQVGTKPSNFEPRVFAMIEALSRNVVLPIAGVILTFIACYELIEMITQHNNMAQFEPVLLMKWIFKTAISVWMISNTFDIIMAVFDVTQQVVANSSGIISGNTRVNDIGLSMLQFASMRELHRRGKTPDPEHYEVTYYADLPAMWQDVPNNEVLEELFQMFNLSRPQDFEGHSLSVSDVIALKRNGEVSVHYVDSIGFKELPGFLDTKPERPSVLMNLKEKCDAPECNPAACRKVRDEHEL